MVGKIDGTPLGGPVRRTDGIAAGKASAPADGSESARPAETARDTRSSLLERARQAADEAPEVDQGRIDRIREAIVSGEYRIDPEATARAFIAMELSGTPGE